MTRLAAEVDFRSWDSLRARGVDGSTRDVNRGLICFTGLCEPPEEVFETVDKVGDDARELRGIVGVAADELPRNRLGGRTTFGVDGAAKLLMLSVVLVVRWREERVAVV